MAWRGLRNLIFVAVPILFGSHHVFAQVSSEDLVFGASPFLVEICYLENLKSNDPPKFRAINKSAFDSLGGLRVIDSQSAEWAFKINKQYQKKAKNSVERLKRVFSGTTCDVVIDASPDIRSWKAYTFNKKSKKVRRLFAAKPPKISTNSIHKWTLYWLGFQGVVVSANENQIVVFAEKRCLIAGAQAIIIGNSENRYKFKRKTKKSADALIQYSKSEGEYALFDVLIKAEDSKEIGPGMKVYFGAMK